MTALLFAVVLLCLSSLAASLPHNPASQWANRPLHTSRSWAANDAGERSTFAANRPATTAADRFTALNSALAAAPPSNWSIVDVYAFGAVGDGQTDNTAAFQSAIDTVAKAGGGTVYASRGYFLFAGSITVPEGVTLEGTYAAVPSHPMSGQHSLPLITGTLLMPTAGEGSEDGKPFITLQRDATVKGLVIYYPAQKPTAAPVPFPWTIDMVSDNSAVLDVECLNCWNFIRAVSSGRHYIARVQGQPINVGVYIDETYDIGRVENVHFNPWYSADPTYMAWQLLHGRAFVVARSDWEYFLNTFAFGYALGYHFIETEAGSCNGNFLGIGADMCVNASVQVDSCDAWGLLITNGEFTSFLDPHFGNLTAGVESSQIVVSASNTGAVRIVNSAFWGPSVHIARIEGSGSVGFGDCIFSQWDANNEKAYAIKVNGTGSLSVRGCEFQQNSNQISLADTVDRAVIVGNLIRGKQRIAAPMGQYAKPQFQIDLNAADE